MDKKKLLEMGLTEEQATAIVKELKASYVDKGTLDQVKEQVSQLTEQVKERDSQIESLKKFEGDAQALQDKLKEMEESNKTKNAEYVTNLLTERKKNAIRLALLEDESGKPYDVSMVAGMFNLDNINLNEDGTIANGFKEQNETLRKDKAFLFNTTQQQTKENGFKRVGTTPADGKQNGEQVDTPEAYGARLAQAKLQMMGISQNTDKQ